MRDLVTYGSTKKIDGLFLKSNQGVKITNKEVLNSNVESKVVPNTHVLLTSPNKHLFS
jgi:hypothetical protein